MAAPSRSSTPATSGLGTGCPESQADGVPCAEIGTDCEICGRAAPCPHVPAASADPGPEPGPDAPAIEL
jgi:hypothetical protein